LQQRQEDMVILGTNCSLNLYLICVVDLMHRKYERKGGSKMTLNIFVGRISLVAVNWKLASGFVNFKIPMRYPSGDTGKTDEHTN
jgi:hypothetical protein